MTPFAEDVFTEPRKAKFLGIETGTRMTVVRLAEGGLFVHSPVALDAETTAARRFDAPTRGSDLTIVMSLGAART
ncbi:MAG: hypothetical protein ACXWUG_31400 [Polyangiales bacterium]